MAIRLTGQQIKNLTNDNEFVSTVALADIITARTHSSTQEHTLYKRPIEEVEARGFPFNVQVVTFMVQSKSDLRKLIAAVDRLKRCDEGKPPE